MLSFGIARSFTFQRDAYIQITTRPSYRDIDARGSKCGARARAQEPPAISNREILVDLFLVRAGSSAEEAHFRCSVTCGDQGVLQLPVYVSGRANTDEDIGWIKRDLNYRIGSCVKPVVYSMVGLQYRQPKPKISVEGNVTLQNLEAT